jgi:1-acyl-sn-glycerol-3-phosphate acyltransferase
MPLRLIFKVVTLLTSYALLKIVFLGAIPKENVPMKGIRRKLYQFIVAMTSKLMMLTTGLSVNVIKRDEVSYEKWLGPNYKSKDTKSGSHSTYAYANHSGNCDAMINSYITRGNTSAIGAAGYTKYPLIGFLAKISQMILVKRSSKDKEARDAAVAQIGERQALVEEKGEFPPVSIFVEGSTGNNQLVMPYKRGAFVAERSLMPVAFHYHYQNNLVHPFQDTINML